MRTAAPLHELDAALAPIRDKPFIVLHDAYRYFEDRFGLAAAGSITVNPERAPGVQRVTDIRDRVRELEGVCVFAEPQFDRRIVDVIDHRGNPGARRHNRPAGRGHRRRAGALLRVDARPGGVVQGLPGGELSERQNTSGTKRWLSIGGRSGLGSISRSGNSTVAADS